MSLVRNLALFVLLFLPLSCATGFVGDLFTGPIRQPRPLAYDVQLFLFVFMPQLLPFILSVPVLHFAYRRWLGGSTPRRRRAVAAAVTPLVFLAIHLAVFRGEFWSLPLLLLVCVPGAIYGATFAIPRTATP